MPRPGQVLGLVGSNGTGKSTALKILAGKLKPNLGRFDVSLGGRVHWHCLPGWGVRPQLPSSRPRLPRRAGQAAAALERHAGPGRRPCCTPAGPPMRLSPSLDKPRRRRPTGLRS